MESEVLLLTMELAVKVFLKEDLVGKGVYLGGGDEGSCRGDRPSPMGLKEIFR